MSASPRLRDATDAELIVAAQSGERQAVDLLARRWWPSVRRWALLELGQRALAEDASQEALVRLVRFVHQCDPERPFSSWLRQIVRNACRDQRQRVAGRREAPWTDRGSLVDRQAAGRDRDIDLERCAKKALEGFSRLSPRQRQVVDLVDLQGKTAVQAAAELGIAAGTARALLHQGRRALRVRLAAYGPSVISLLRDA